MDTYEEDGRNPEPNQARPHNHGRNGQRHAAARGGLRGYEERHVNDHARRGGLHDVLRDDHERGPLLRKPSGIGRTGGGVPRHPRRDSHGGESAGYQEGAGDADERAGGELERRHEVDAVRDGEWRE